MALIAGYGCNGTRSSIPVLYCTVLYCQLHRVVLQEQLAVEMPNHPAVTLATELAREAHWKVAAPKGFASLKGIPELQQLLAYTSADVVHYSTEK